MYLPKRQSLLIFKNKKFIKWTILSAIFLVIGLFVNHFAVIYTDIRASSPVADLILSNIPTFDVDMIFVYGPLFFWILITYLLLVYPKRIPFILFSIALFIVIRSVFVSLTHLGPFYTQTAILSHNFISNFSTGKDFFFSGHTGLPFLLALIFEDIKPIRNIGIMISIFFGIIVLMGHYHYSIDVLAAFFITYTIYHIAIYIFKKQYSFFKN